jgi:hypothetical protein
MATAAAEALAAGAAPFAEQGPLPLRALYAAGEHVMVCRSDFLDKHAWRIAKALGARPADMAIPFHPGVRSFEAGRPEPRP